MSAAAPMAELTELLLSTYPLAKLLRGEKREHLKRAWRAAALKQATLLTGAEEGTLPTHPKAVCLALHAAVIALGKTQGMSVFDFISAFNQRVDDGEKESDDADELMRRCVALLAVLGARRMEGA